MAGVFDSIPTITIVLFALGLAGVFVYQKLHRPNASNESKS